MVASTISREASLCFSTVRVRARDQFASAGAVLATFDLERAFAIRATGRAGVVANS